MNVSPTQVKHNSKAHDPCLELADFLSREGSAYSSIYKAEAANTFPERAELVVARAMLAHIFEHENIPPDSPFLHRSLWIAGRQLKGSAPSVIKHMKIE